MFRPLSFLRRGLLLVLALWVVHPLAATAQSDAAAPAATAEPPRNVILFIADGCGPASYTMARDYRRYKGMDAPMLDQYQTGSIRTFASNSRVTDSAAGATAFSAGVKTYNGAIAVDTLKQPVATILEAAEQRGKSTGLVATSRITHATPAAFSAHVSNRGEEAIIAEQQLGQGIEVLLGGGRGWFLGREEDGWRDDKRNLMDEAAAQGYTVVQAKAAFDSVTVPPLLGLFADSHMAYEIDRDPADEPSLAEMTTKAIDLLDDDPDGFFLMIEGSRIDHAGHGNDAAGHLHDILAFQDAVQAALAFAEADGETLVVVTSDHETGGLTLGAKVNGESLYTWKPEVLDQVQASHGAILREVQRRLREPNASAAITAYTASVFTGVMKEWAGITLDDDEAVRLAEAVDDDRQAADVLADVIAERAVIGWTTNGHTAVDVNLYAYGPGRDAFVGHYDNTYVGKTLAELWDMDLEALSQQLQVTVGSN
jgi:alkaline phosphatase